MEICWYKDTFKEIIANEFEIEKRYKNKAKIIALGDEYADIGMFEVCDIRKYGEEVIITLYI